MDSPGRRAWRFAPRAGLAWIVVLAAWGIAGFLVLAGWVGLVFAGPWDPGDLTAQMWRDQAERYRSARETVLLLLSPVALVMLAAAIGGLVRRWAAPLVFAIGVALALCVSVVPSILAVEGQIDAALTRAAEPTPAVLGPLNPPPAPTYSPDVLRSAVVARLDRTLQVSEQPATLADGTPLGASAVPLSTIDCGTTGSAIVADLVFRTADNVTTEQAILAAWVVDGFVPDRAAGTNLLHAGDADPISRATLRGLPDGTLHLTIESRCTTG